MKDARNIAKVFIPSEVTYDATDMNSKQASNEVAEKMGASASFEVSVREAIGSTNFPMGKQTMPSI